MHPPTDSIAHTTVFVTPVVEHGLERDVLIDVFNEIDGMSTIFYVSW